MLRPLKSGGPTVESVGTPMSIGSPDRLDLTRTPNPHLGFGLGTHFCPGAQLSRMEARAAIPALLARFPRLELAGEPVWRQTFILRGLERLPVRAGRAGGI